MDDRADARFWHPWLRIQPHARHAMGSRRLEYHQTRDPEGSPNGRGSRGLVQLNVRTLRAGALYFAVVLAAGWVLGPLRELFVGPRLGRTMATLLEAPIMLAVTIVAARWVVRRLAVPDTHGARAAVGVVALGLLLIAEVVGVRWVRGASVCEYLEGLDPVALGTFVVMLLLFAVMPMLIERPLTRHERASRQSLGAPAPGRSTLWA